MEFISETSPHLRRKSSVSRMMIDVLIALLPTLVFGLVMNGLAGLKVILVSVVTMLLAEFVYVGLRNIGPYDGVKRTFKEKFIKSYSNFSITNILSPLVSAIIFALIMPASSTWYQVFAGALFGIVFAKLLFGGLGQNVFNPAGVGRIFAALCFGSTWTYSGNAFYDVVAGGTPLNQLYDVITGGTSSVAGSLANMPYSLLDLFIGTVPGAIGETSALCILIGGIYLLIRRSADFRIMLSMLVTFVLMSLFAGIAINASNVFEYMLYHLLSGGFMFGMVFMATDPVTSPITRPGRIIYGTLIASITILIRLFGAYPEGMCFAILIANTFVPVIDYYKWSTNKYNYKHLIIVLAILGIISLCIFLGL